MNSIRIQKGTPRFKYFHTDQFLYFVDFIESFFKYEEKF